MKRTIYVYGFCALLMLSCGLSGCASSTYGTQMDRDKVSQIKKGVTTRAEVEALMGRGPDMVNMMGDGRRVMMYSYHETNAHVKGQSFIPFAGAFVGGSAAQTRSQQLQIFLNKANVVEDYEFSDNTTNIDNSRFHSEAITTPTTQPSK